MGLHKRNEFVPQEIVSGFVGLAVLDELLTAAGIAVLA